MEARQFMAMILAQILFLSVLGPRTWRQSSTPLLYLFFLIPSGGFLTPALQSFTAQFIKVGLDLFGIVNFADNMVIQIPEGTFYVAEACAGLRFLVASLAFGVLYSCVMYRSIKPRLIFIALSIIVPIIANGLRALGIVLAAHVIGSADAAAADHVLYGWLFFSIVTLLLILIGALFRDRSFNRTLLDGFPYSGRIGKSAVVSAATLLTIVTGSRLLADALDDTLETQPNLTRLEFSVPAGCQETPLSGGEAGNGLHGKAVAYSRAFLCDRDLFIVRLHQYPPRIGARAVFMRELIDPSWEMVATKVIRIGSGIAAQQWSEVEFANSGRLELLASAVWVNGRSVSGIMGRVQQALNTIRSTPTPTLVSKVSYTTSKSPPDAQLAMERFLLATNGSLISLGHDQPRLTREGNGQE